MVESEFSKLVIRVRFPSPARFSRENNLKKQIAIFLHHLGLSANGATRVGLLCAGASAFLIYLGLFFWAGGLLLLSGLFDLLDGAIARLSGATGKFGGILDSSLDRYGDALVFGAMLFFFVQQEQALWALLTFSALVGSFSTSYIRARAECEIENCRTGFWERGERTVFIALGLIFNNLGLVIWVLAFGTHWTACQRLWAARQTQASSKMAPLNRRSITYFAKIITLFFAVVLYRVS